MTQKAILLAVRLKVPEKKELTEVMLLLYHSNSGTVRSLIAVHFLIAITTALLPQLAEC